MLRRLKTVRAQSEIDETGARRSICRTAALALARTAARPRGSPIAHGRKAVRAQSAILDKTPALSLLLSITVFSVRMVFIRTENTVGARSAQGRPTRSAAILNKDNPKPSFFFVMNPYS
ncbi:MAG TPA: hypothetical protein VIJ43_02495 [Burkholderiales bacterium]